MEKIAEVVPANPTVTSIMAGIVIMLGLHLAVQLWRVAIKYINKDNELTARKVDGLIHSLDQLTDTITKFDERIKLVERTVVEGYVDLAKQKVDTKRIFIALRGLAGDSWDELVKKMSEHEFHP